MPNPFNCVLEVLATATASDLRRQVQFLRAENQIPPEQAQVPDPDNPSGTGATDPAG